MSKYSIRQGETAVRNTDRPSHPPSWIYRVLPAGGLLTGFSADVLLSSGRIDLLAFPVLSLLLWNLAIYVLTPLKRFRPRREGRELHEFVPWLARLCNKLFEKLHAGGSEALDDLQTRDLSHSILLSRIRASVHLSAVTTTVGLMIGMYLQGVALEYRAGWSSTFLEADTLRIILVLILGPAAWITGIGIPNVEALRSLAWSAGTDGEIATNWIHLYAVTCILVVVLPRLMLTLWSLGTARRRERELQTISSNVEKHPAPNMSSPHFERICIIPFNHLDVSKCRSKCRCMFDGMIDDRQSVPYEKIDEYFDVFKPNESSDLYVAAFDLSATPEAEVHGRMIDRLKQAAGPCETRVCLDTNAYAERFAGYPERVGERKKSWSDFLAPYGVTPIFTGEEV